MLTSLNIQNYALIDNLNIQFGKGFNVLTGETGAGKSIIVGALTMVLGERATGDLIRSGADRAFIEAQFDITGNKAVRESLEKAGLDPESTLILSREILSSGRTQTRVNGRLVTQAMLKRITEELIDIHGQHEHQSLLHAENHIDVLDTLGGDSISHLRIKVAQDYGTLEELNNRLRYLKQSQEDREKKTDFLRFQIKEIDEAQPREGEEEDLLSEKAILSNARKLMELANNTYESLAGETSEIGGVTDNLKKISAWVKEMASIDKGLSKLQENLESTSYQIEDITRELGMYRDKIEFNPQRQEEVEDRLYLIKQLKRKYGPTVKEIKNYRQKIESELSSLIGRDEQIVTHEEKIKKLSQRLKKEALELSQRRQRFAQAIEKAVVKELEDLNMTKTKFKINIEQQEIGPKGIDQVEFLISPNPGELLKPLVKIASGGEISRIMLALKSILVNADLIPTLIFDEIDVGIGGKAAIAVGEKLGRLARKRQVLCITHLPQIASHSHTHIYVDKKVVGKRTKVSVRRLNKEEERISELARMISGKVLETSLHTAKEMLKKANSDYV